MDDENCAQDMDNIRNINIKKKKKKKHKAQLESARTYAQVQNEMENFQCNLDYLSDFEKNHKIKHLVTNSSNNHESGEPSHNNNLDSILAENVLMENDLVYSKKSKNKFKATNGDIENYKTLESTCIGDYKQDSGEGTQVIKKSKKKHSTLSLPDESLMEITSQEEEVASGLEQCQDVSSRVVYEPHNQTDLHIGNTLQNLKVKKKKKKRKLDDTTCLDELKEKQLHLDMPETFVRAQEPNHECANDFNDNQECTNSLNDNQKCINSFNDNKECTDSLKSKQGYSNSLNNKELSTRTNNKQDSGEEILVAKKSKKKKKKHSTLNLSDESLMEISPQEENVASGLEQCQDTSSGGVFEPHNQTDLQPGIYSEVKKKKKKKKRKLDDTTCLDEPNEKQLHLDTPETFVKEPQEPNQEYTNYFNGNQESSNSFNDNQECNNSLNDNQECTGLLNGNQVHTDSFNDNQKCTDSLSDNQECTNSLNDNQESTNSLNDNQERTGILNNNQEGILNCTDSLNDKQKCIDFLNNNHECIGSLNDNQEYSGSTNYNQEFTASSNENQDCSDLLNDKELSTRKNCKQDSGEEILVAKKSKKKKKHSTLNLPDESLMEISPQEEDVASGSEQCQDTSSGVVFEPHNQAGLHIGNAFILQKKKVEKKKKQKLDNTTCLVEPNAKQIYMDMQETFVAQEPNQECTNSFNDNQEYTNSFNDNQEYTNSFNDNQEYTNSFNDNHECTNYLDDNQECTNSFNNLEYTDSLNDNQQCTGSLNEKELSTGKNNKEVEFISNDDEASIENHPAGGNEAGQEKTPTLAKYKKYTTRKSLKRQSNSLVPTEDYSIKEIMDFTPPKLHGRGTICKITKEELAAFKESGFEVKTGKWSSKEVEILERNYQNFLCNHPGTDYYYLFISSGKIAEDRLKRIHYLKTTNFYYNLGRDLNTRTLLSIYTKAITMFHPLRKQKVDKETKEKVLKLYHMFENITKDVIGKELKVHPETVKQIIKWEKKKNNTKGPWSKKENEQLKMAIKKVMKTDAIKHLTNKIPWEKVAELVPSRNNSQCRHHWLLHELWEVNNKHDRIRFNTPYQLKLIYLIYHSGKHDEVEIDWKGLSEEFNNIPSYAKLVRVWINLKNSKVPENLRKNFKDIIEYLYSVHLKSTLSCMDWSEEKLKEFIRETRKKTQSENTPSQSDEEERETDGEKEVNSQSPQFKSKEYLESSDEEEF